jgi:ketosteroid isomerase-like protein
LDSPRVALVRRLLEFTDGNELQLATEELIRHSVDDVVLEPHVGHGRTLRGHEELREFWAKFLDEGRQIRAGVYSIVEEGDTIVVTGWLRMIEEGRLADTQTRWVYEFDDDDRIVSARVQRS